MSAEQSAEATPLGDAPEFEGGLQQVADATYAWIQPNGGLGESNAGLVVGSGSSLLIDTLWDERLTARMLEAMAPVRAGAPITTLFNTHGDGDHWYGNGLLGGAQIIASVPAAKQMRTEPPSLLTRMAPLPRIAGAASSIPLLPGRDRMRGLAGFGRQLACYEFAGLQPRLPSREFSGSEQLDAGGREVRLIEVGPAHTVGDAIAWLPDARVCFSGDIVFNGVTPIMWAGPVRNWIAALERIEELAPAVVVPGHGPVTDLAGVRAMAGYWRWLEARVSAGAAGSEMALAEELIGSTEYRADWGDWRSPERTLVNIAMIARECNDEGGPIGIAKRIGLIAEMGELAERLS